jgi:hypothetical protein
MTALLASSVRVGRRCRRAVSASPARSEVRAVTWPTPIQAAAPHLVNSLF